MSTTKPSSIAAEIYRAPVSIGAKPARILESEAEVEAFFKRVITGIRADGYGRSEVLGLSVDPANDDEALVQLSYRRYLENGSGMGPAKRQGTYQVRRTDERWLITGIRPASD